MTTYTVRRLVSALENARKEFATIARRYRRSKDSALANEEIDLWAARTSELLAEFGVDEAATKLRKAKGTIKHRRHSDSRNQTRRAYYRSS